jgi:hypothetical protein
MVSRSKTGSAAKRGKVKVGKLKLTKETVKKLSSSDLKKVKGASLRPTRVQQ